MFHRRLFVVAIAAALASASIVSQTFADWTQFALPNLSGAFSPTAISVLPDGRYVFANQGAYYQQDAFGLPGYTAYSNVSPGNNADPSFLAIWDATHAVAGGGGFGASDLYRFDPASLSAPTFTAQGVSLQNFSGVFRDANSLYVGGGNGTISTHAISYVNLATATTKVIIDNISTFSCAFAQDAAGDLYVGDNDNQKVYKFTAAQLSLAISGAPLAITNGTFVYQSINSLGSMAVDGSGRIWSSGFLANGLQVYDPLSNTETTVVPGLTNANYMVTTFSVGGQNYVGYTDEANPFAGGTPQYYGFEAVPEPGTFGLVASGLVAVALSRRKQQRLI
jgi:PEP-CTERM motif